MRVARVAVGTLCALALRVMLPVPGSVAGATDASWAPAAAPSKGRPNILVIVSDDQAWSVFSRKLMPAVYGQLVDRGVLFRRAYASTSLCCPSRAEILTGLYEHDTGVDDNDVPLTRPTIVDGLRDAGYRTYLAGKYLNSWNSCQPRPEFDEWACVVSHEPSSNSLKGPNVNVNGTWRHFNGYQPDVLGSLLADDIQATPADQPFLALFTPTTPHLPADDPRYDTMPVSPPRGPSFNVNTMTEDAPRFVRRPPLTQDEIARSKQQYVAMAHATRSFDDAVSALLASLGNRAQDTMVVYISDNGFLYGEHRRMGKNDAWEEAVRVPMVVRYPAALPADRAFVTDALVANVDIAPTIADLAGISWNADGRSFLPLVARQRKTIHSAILLEHCRGVNRGTPECSGLHFDGGNTDTPGFQGIVTPRYKYVEYDDGSRQLVDLRRDPRELTNLLAGPDRSPQRLALASRLKGQLGRLALPPATTTIATGPGPLTSRLATFRYFAPASSAAYRCRLLRDGRDAPWAPCPGETVNFADLADGTYRFEVAGADEQGRWDPTPAVRSFTVTTRGGPDVALTATPSTVVRQGSATFGYASSLDIAQFRCRLSRGGSGEWGPCDAGGSTYDGLGDGGYVFEVAARDPNTGAVSRPAAAWAFTVDASGPDVTFQQTPPRTTRSDRAAFRFTLPTTSSGPVRCSVDGRSAADCASGSFRVEGLGGGYHTFSVEATDEAGTRARVEYRWEIDRNAPMFKMNDVPTAFSNDTDPIFDLWTDADPGFYLCSLDGSPLMPCFTAARMNGLKDGKHRFAALALDAALNRSERKVFRWTVDTIAPGLVLTGSPQQGDTTTSRQAAFDIDANEPVTVYCALDGAAYAECGAHVSYDGLVPGEHSFSAYVVDRARNQSIVVGRTWTVS
ncbi:MAG: sulfatase-like hydrolase/transferase [Actinomycetota bacterium]